MEVNQHIFRANDISVAYEDLTEEVVIQLGKSLGSEALERGVKDFVIVEMEGCPAQICMSGYREESYQLM